MDFDDLHLLQRSETRKWSEAVVERIQDRMRERKTRQRVGPTTATEA